MSKTAEDHVRKMQGISGIGYIREEDDFLSPNPEIRGTIRYINKHFYVHAGCQEQIFDNIKDLVYWIGAELEKQIKIHESAENEIKKQWELKKKILEETEGLME